jgi:AcrR family transcriptional regulator
MSVGRPRSEATTKAVLDATLALLCGEAYGRLSIERIAATANVAKTAIYRRWESKAVLVAEALRGDDAPFVERDTGDVTADLVALLERAWAEAHLPHRRVALRVMVESHHDHELASAIRDQVIEPRREALRRVLRRGVERGQLAPDCDIELLADLLVGPLLRAVLLEHGQPLPTDLARRTVELALEGAKAGRIAPVPQ